MIKQSLLEFVILGVVTKLPLKDGKANGVVVEIYLEVENREDNELLATVELTDYDIMASESNVPVDIAFFKWLKSKAWRKSGLKNSNLLKALETSLCERRKIFPKKKTYWLLPTPSFSFANQECLFTSDKEKYLKFLTTHSIY